MHKKIPLIFLLFSALLFQPVCLLSQNNEDFMIWSGFSLKKDIAPRTSIGLRQEVRLEENASQVQKAFIDIGLRHKINKYVRVAVHYRNSQNVRKDLSFSSRHRINTDLILQNKWKFIVISYRLRYQMNFKDYFTSENGRIPDQFIRHKVQAEFDLNKRLTPYLASEFFHTVPDFPNVDWVQNRFRIGVDYEITRNNSLSIFYMLRTKQIIETPSTDYILGIRYNIKI